MRLTINVADYEMTITDNHKVWVYNPAGEGMEINQDHIKNFLDKLWEREF